MVEWCTQNLRRDSSSFRWHQPCNNQRALFLGILKIHAINGLIQNHMRHERSESAGEQRIALYKCNRVYCIHVPGHNPLTFSFRFLFLFDWVGVLWPQLSKVLKLVQELCESRGGRPGLSVLTSLLVSVDVKIY